MKIQKFGIKKKIKLKKILKIIFDEKKISYKELNPNIKLRFIKYNHSK